MKRVLVVLVVLLLVLSPLTFAQEAEEPEVQEVEETEVEEITEEDKVVAKPIPGDAITIELGKIGIETWKKYLYFDVSGDLNNNSQTFWTRLGASKGDFDISIGWGQRINGPEDEPRDKGTISMAISYWW